MKADTTQLRNFDDDEIIAWAHDELADSMNRLSKWREEASTCYDFYAGEQWKDAIYENTDDETEQQTVTFNRVARSVNAVAGVEMQNRRQIKFYPREPGKAGLSEKMTSSAKWVRDLTEAEHEESESFLDLLICGMGFTQLMLEADMKEPQIQYERVDPLEMLWDARAKKKNLEDTKWRARLRQLTEPELLERWPEVDLGKALKGRKYLDYPTKPHDSTPPAYDNDSDTAQQNNEGGYEVIELEYWEYEEYYQLLTEEGSLVEFTPAKWSKVKEYADQRGLRYAKRRRKAYKVLFFTGMALLHEEPLISQHGFTIQAVTGLRNRNTNTWFGLVSLMRDPQRWANKWLTQILHTVNTNTKGGLLAETDAFEDVRQAEDSWSSADSITWIKPGGLAKIQEKSFGQVPAGIDRLLQYALDAIASTSGVNVEMLGIADRDQAGIVEESRKRAGITIVAMFFDAQRLYYKLNGKILMELIREYIADGRLMRLWGETGMQYIPLIKDELATDYDVIVDDAPDSPDVRDKTFSALLQVVPMAMQAGIPIPPEILEYAPFPEDLIMKWKEKLQPQEPDPEQLAKQQEQEQIQMETQKAVIAEMQSKAGLNMASAKVKAQELEIEEQKLKLQGMQAGFDAQMDKNKYENEIKLKNLELEAKEKEMTLKSAQMGFDGQMRKQEFEFEQKLAILKHEQEMEVLKLKAMSTLEQMEERDGIRIREMQDSVTRHAEAITDMLNALQSIQSQVTKPRKRTLVRDKNGRATHAIDVIISDDDLKDLH